MRRLFLLPFIICCFSTVVTPCMAQDADALPATVQAAPRQDAPAQGDSLVSDTARIMEAYRAVEDDPTVGSPVPDFALQPLDQPSRTVTNRNMRNRTYLIVFWSPRDRAGMPYLVSLAESLEPWRGRGLTVITVALKSSAAEVTAKRSALPSSGWLFSVPSRKHGDEMLKSFDTWRLPAAYLVDRHGTIVAAGEKLRPPWLDVTLELVLR